MEETEVMVPLPSFPRFDFSHRLQHPQGVSHIELSRDGQWLVTAAGPPSRPDGDRVLLAFGDRASIFDATSGALLPPVLNAASNIDRATFSHDGQRVLLLASSEARIWDTPVDQGSLDDWRALARCSPTALVDGAVVDRKDARGALVECERGRR